MKLSIITINYNNCEGLRKTIDSVVAQTWKDFEWIIVDGGSTDGSRELIEETAARLQSDGWHTEQFSLLGFTAEDWKNGKFTVPSKESLTLLNSPQHASTNMPQLKWTSEKDNGIYNAMNKGIVMAQGEYLLFLNSGDILSDSDSMKRVSETKFEADIISFDIYVDSISRKGYRKSVDKFNSFWYCDNFLYHPSTWINKKCLVELPYHEEYKIVSDWVFFFEALVIKGYLYQHVPLAFSVFYNDGISSSPVYYEKSLWERNDFMKKHFPPKYLLDKDNEYSFHYLSKGVANMRRNKQKMIKLFFLILAKIEFHFGSNKTL